MWGEKLNILVIDSDHDMVEMVTGWLRARGYTVHFCFSADKARALWLERKPELVIAEVKQSGVDIMEVCRELRVQHDALVLAVTEDPNPTIEAHCLESGADDFLPKPFLPKLLLAHLRALSRRVRSTLQRQPTSQFSIGPIRFDASRNEIVVNGRVSHLTPTESRILQILSVNMGDVCTQNQIVSHAWGYGDEGDTYLIKAHIRHLREKIEPSPSKPRYIRTVPGVGYTLTLGAEAMSTDALTASSSMDDPADGPLGAAEDPSRDGDEEDGISDRRSVDVRPARDRDLRLATTR